MTFAFDLISDLHLETWPDRFDWEGKPTSPYCVVAGDVSKDRHLVLRTLKHLGQCYQAVFYIDGNDEHANYYPDLKESYQALVQSINKIENVVFLQDNVIVINGVAILGTNGWWGFDFGDIDATQAANWWLGRLPSSVTAETAKAISNQCTNDAIYIASSVKRLQTHGDVQSIVVVTHTVPNPDLILHDIDLNGTYRFNCMGNANMMTALETDHNRKIHTWCFGHYHMPVDTHMKGIRFVNNCRGQGNTQYRQWSYQPRRIEINF